MTMDWKIAIAFGIIIAMLLGIHNKLYALDRITKMLQSIDERLRSDVDGKLRKVNRRLASIEYSLNRITKRLYPHVEDDDDYYWPPRFDKDDDDESMASYLEDEE